jgi:hypothetical protein
MPLLILLGVLVLTGVLFKHFPFLFWFLLTTIFGPFILCAVIVILDPNDDSPLGALARAMPSFFTSVLIPWFQGWFA